MTRWYFRLIFLCIAGWTAHQAQAQELQARVTVNSSRVGPNVNRSTFQTLQNALNTFLNARKWTTDNFLPNERIECNFFLNLQPTNDVNVYSGSLMIQAGRPIFSTSYLSPLVNFQDEDILFKYIEFQQLEFNDNRVTGNDAQASNLTAIFAYYAYMIIGLDYNTFSLKGGMPLFIKAQNVINNAPDGRGIVGWKAFDGIRNRYWLTENLLNSRYNIIHDVFYNYYRASLDQLYTDEAAARAEMLNVLNLLQAYNTDNPNTMINQFFFQGKATELIKLFSKGQPQDKQRASDILQKVDVTNAPRYRDELK
jgi:hypothetical protein